MAMSEPVSGDALNLELSVALSAVYREQHWREPTSTTTLHRENVVASVMHDVLSPAEIMLVRDGSAEHVRRLRAALREASEGGMRAAVERLTGRTVTSVFSDDQLATAMEAHVFMLDQPI